ncbi:MAG: hypothetical protein HQK88_15530 [Nitrospirae bacterium]|nr:hypothetical protein [Nitrospirota bacterium]MBF0518916.1 hypothetical protein [Nitrospirota bacterium]MBF0536163.1 hypothetical protein [Nitrospirota bacterium]MBF0618212.1 hypothetical protein [Nitrospirota bacterium]
MALSLIVIALSYKFMNKIGCEFVNAQKEQASALARQAQSMEGLHGAIHDFLTKDNKEHLDILIMLRVIIDRMDRNQNG